MPNKPATVAPTTPTRPAQSTLIKVCVAGWLVPGWGHFLLGHRWRALILFASIVTMFVMGVAMQGIFFSVGSASYLETLGYFGELCVGVAMPVARFFGFTGGNPLFASSDYGTAYLVAAGMLNVLAIFDAFDIAMGRKP